MIETTKLSDPSLVYMYGLSDFWVEMFGDKQLVETILAGETIQLAEAYSYFLQRSAGISLTDIQDKYETRIKLLILDQSDLADPSDLSSFRVDTSIVGMSKISNRPVLPTQTLSDGIHFDILDNVLKFHKPIDQLKFPIRYNSDGTWQYAVWMCDVEIDEKWIDTTFGQLVGFTEEDAIFNYKSFLEGVYFLYTNGPNISYIERGVNLAMGMPYARETEDILDISQDELTSNWVVFTAGNSYEIPYNFRPDLVVGETITQGDVLSTWVEVKDYSTSGTWWYQIYLPREVLGPGIEPSDIGVIYEGTTGDVMMNNFLKHHMFEVLITQPSSDITAFNTARELVLGAKPSYSYPVFVWKASVDDEIINLEDDFHYDYGVNLTDHCVSPPSIRFMDRSVEHDDFNRGTNWYNRVQGSTYLATLLGYGDWEGNGGWAPQFDSVDDATLEYLDVTMRTRGDLVSPTTRGTVTRGWRGHVDNIDIGGDPLDDTPIGFDWEVPESNVYGIGSMDFIVNERDLTPLYLMSRTEFIDKMLTIDPRFKIENRNKFVVTGLNLVDVYDQWMVRNDSINTDASTSYKFEYSEGDLDISFSPFAHQTFVPARDDMYDEDELPILDGSLLITRSTDSSWVCQWIRTRVSAAPTLFPIEDQDWTKAIEQYTFDDLGTEENNDGISINAEVERVQTPRLVDTRDDLLLITDGLYVKLVDYAVDLENSTAEGFGDLGIPSRSYAVLYNTPVTQGYLAYDQSGSLTTVEETLSPEIDDTYILSETPAKEQTLVVINGVFEFDYTILGNILTLGTPSGDVTVRYVDHRLEEVLTAGSSSYTLGDNGHCKIFIGSRLLEDWAYIRSGSSVTLSSVATEDLTVRYDSHDTFTKVSGFTRSTVEENQARFLMDRSREDGEYDDYLGQTVFMNRGGVPTLSNGSPADDTNVIRRLR